jgi:hypothetical protein
VFDVVEPDVVVVDADVAAKTQGDASKAAAMAIPAIAASVAVLVFILRRRFGGEPHIYWISEMVPESTPIRRLIPP